ncbi:MAG: class III extradiol ring-cleavage dioxygenase [Anaerolineaceae bacterium]
MILPTLFISHGSPETAIADTPAHDFLQTLGERYQAVRAALLISAHWESACPVVSASQHPETIHDFSGFPDELYQIKYPAQGSPKLAAEIAGMLESAGLQCEIDSRRGLDHGAWVPLSLMFPDANIPVAQLSIQQGLDPGVHLALGDALEDLRKEGMLVIGSGGSVHPLGYVTFPSPTPFPWAVAFDDWLTDAVQRGDRQALVDYHSEAPFPERAHPRPDHYMPLLVALGAAGPVAKGKVLHQSWEYGFLSMGMYAFDDQSS